MEVTRREILVSIGIVLVLAAIAVWVTVAVVDETRHKNQVYMVAPTMESEEQLAYAINTKFGNVFSELTMQEVAGTGLTNAWLDRKLGPATYARLDIIYERWESHQETYTTTTTDDDGNTHTQTHTKTVWDWERKPSLCSYTSVESVLICSTEVPFSMMDVGTSIYEIEEFREDDGWFSGTKARRKYYALPFGETYSAFLDTSAGELKSYGSESIILYRRSIDDLRAHLGSRNNLWLVLVWGVWLIVTIGLVALFYYADNHWLNNDRQ